MMPSRSRSRSRSSRSSSRSSHRTVIFRKSSIALLFFSARTLPASASCNGQNLQGSCRLAPCCISSTCRFVGAIM
ncbi:hypothetical protein B0H15DRAFT_933827 [Mycena belliarum]|uniref:Uncharacterized protein n=1 Tax=Mycena belliarum TaxID=1033014 RepID=A0AAD6TTZ1_9AGAR|nr:hypothetical protein B0H15DRAFT_933827 [Mycena belliae]